MTVNVDKKMVSLNKSIARGTEVTWVEQDILVPDSKPDVMKIIQVEAVPFIGNAETIDGGIRVSGETTYYIIYREMNDDKTHGISMTYPFSKTINVPDAKKSMNTRVTVTTRNLIYSLPNERKVSIKSELVFKYVVRDKSDIELIQGMKEGIDIEAKTSQDTFYNVIDVKNEVIDAKEDIIIPDTTPQIGEILQVSTNISNTDYKVSYNKILVKGDVNLEILYLEANNIDNGVIYNTSIPFTGMIEFENIKEDYRFDISYNLRNLEITLGENGIINVSMEVNVDAIMFEENKVEYVNDFYSTKNKLNYDKTEVAVIKNKELIEKQITLKENIGSIDDNNKIISYKIDTNHLNTKITGNNLYVDGPLKITVVFQNNDNKMLESKTFDLLVNSNLNLGKEIDEKNTNIDITVLNKSVLLQNGNVEADVVLNVALDVQNVDKVIVIGNIEEESINPDEFDSMYMYIVKKGDTLWDIAKKYKTTVDKIANINNIVDENKIDIGQKLLIIR